MSEYAPQGFRMLPPAVKNLIIINVICFLAREVLLRYNPLVAFNLCLLPFEPATFQEGTFHFQFWQPITYMFMHGNLSHLFFNMFALWMFGYVIENFWGTRRFLIYYFACGLGAALVSMVMNIYLPGFHVTLGASGAVYGILLAFGMMFPNERIYLYFIAPIKAKWFVIGYAVLELFEGVFFSMDGVAHFAHLGGMLTGFILIMLWRKRKNNPFYRG